MNNDFDTMMMNKDNGEFLRRIDDVVIDDEQTHMMACCRELADHRCRLAGGRVGGPVSN